MGGWWCSHLQVGRVMHWYIHGWFSVMVHQVLIHAFIIQIYPSYKYALIQICSYKYTYKYTLHDSESYSSIFVAGFQYGGAHAWCSCSQAHMHHGATPNPANLMSKCITDRELLDFRSSNLKLPPSSPYQTRCTHMRATHTLARPPLNHLKPPLSPCNPSHHT